MKENWNDKPTFIAASKAPLSIMAGGGPSGFGAVAVYKPQEEIPDQLSLYPELERGTFGIGFPYNDTARIHVNGCRRWINSNLSDAPKRRQDICETGNLRLELFDSQELKAYIEQNREALKKLGLIFVH